MCFNSKGPDASVLVENIVKLLFKLRGLTADLILADPACKCA
jgi:hypothetical protein